MILNNQNIMIYGSDEEKSLSVIGITSGLFTVPDGETYTFHVDLSDIKYKKLLLSVIPEAEGSLTPGIINFSRITLNLNENQFTHNMFDTSSPAATSIARQPLLEYCPSNCRGITMSVSCVPEEGPIPNVAYYIAFIA
jgi:hypothetical protein